VFVVHGSETALKIAEWGRARRFYESRIGVGDGAFLDYFQDLRELFIIGVVWFHLNPSLSVYCCDELSGHRAILGDGVLVFRAVFARW
jgi:hypothetical protein